MKNTPPYPLYSVDNALLLLHLLRDTGSLRVGEAAAALGVAPSTAHRLLSMLVYRDFAFQDAQRVYRPGSALSAPLHEAHSLQQLPQVLLPVMAELREEVNETVHLMIRVGPQTRFLASVECNQPLRVSDRRGSVIPAHLTTGGLLLLAELDDSEVARLLKTELSDAAIGNIQTELGLIRQRGFAMNLERSEQGVFALGMPIRTSSGAALAVLAIAMPSARHSSARVDTLLKSLRTAVVRAESLPMLALQEPA